MGVFVETLKPLLRLSSRFCTVQVLKCHWPRNTLTQVTPASYSTNSTKTCQLNLSWVYWGQMSGITADIIDRTYISQYEERLVISTMNIKCWCWWPVKRDLRKWKGIYSCNKCRIFVFFIPNVSKLSQPIQGGCSITYPRVNIHKKMLCRLQLKACEMKYALTCRT